MKKIISLSILLFLLGSILTIISCRRMIEGCTDPTALNYNSSANENNGTCIAKVFGCTDPTSVNYNPSANVDNGTCLYTGYATFWVSTPFATAIIVSIGGQQESITSYYSPSSPTCGSVGCANFTLYTGSYSFTASNNSGTATGNITVTANGCALVQLSGLTKGETPKVSIEYKK